MRHCAFIYTPKLAHASVQSLMAGLSGAGVVITHLGTSIPPKEWSGDGESAVSLIVSGMNLTKRTFLRDDNSRVSFSIERHRGPKWEHDTISFSGAPESRVRQIVESIAHEVDHYIAVVGVVGGGESQVWHLISLSQRCPESLRRQFASAEPCAPPYFGPATGLGYSGATEAPPSAN